MWSGQWLNFCLFVSHPPINPKSLPPQLHSSLCQSRHLESCQAEGEKNRYCYCPTWELLPLLNAVATQPAPLHSRGWQAPTTAGNLESRTVLGDFFPLLSTPTRETSSPAWINFTLALHSAPLSAALYQLSFSCVKSRDTQTPAPSWNASCTIPSREVLDGFFSLLPKLQTSEYPQYCKTWGEDRFTWQAAVGYQTAPLEGCL